jgi:hypothetical protein
VQQGFKEGRALGWVETRNDCYLEGVKLGGQVGFSFMQLEALQKYY